MSLLQAIIMGIIQGVTEFLPVSSSGHLAIFKILFHMETDTGLLFDVILHLGTLIAIFAVYYKDILRMIVEGVCIIRDVCINIARFFRNKFMHEENEYLKIVKNGYRKFVMLVIVSTIFFYHVNPGSAWCGNFRVEGFFTGFCQRNRGCVLSGRYGSCGSSRLYLH